MSQDENQRHEEIVKKRDEFLKKKNNDLLDTSGNPKTTTRGLDNLVLDGAIAITYYALFSLISGFFSFFLCFCTLKACIWFFCPELIAQNGIQLNEYETLNFDLIRKNIPKRLLGDDLGRFNDATCTICIMEIDRSEEIREIKSCGHIFHAGCLENWLKVKESCPLCKTVLDCYQLDRETYGERPRTVEDEEDLVDDGSDNEMPEVPDEHLDQELMEFNLNRLERNIQRTNIIQGMERNFEQTQRILTNIERLHNSIRIAMTIEGVPQV